MEYQQVHTGMQGDGMEQKHTVMQGDDSSLGREASEHSWGSLNSGQLGEKSFTTKSKSQGLKTQGPRPCGTQRNFNQGGDSCVKL